MPTLLYFHHAHASMRQRRNGTRQVEVNGMMITSHEGSHKTIIGQPGSSSSAWKWMDPIPLGLALNWHACRESRVARVTTSTPEIVQAALSSLRPHSASDTLTLLLHFIKQIDQQPSPARRPTSTTTGTASRNRARLPQWRRQGYAWVFLGIPKI